MQAEGSITRTSIVNGVIQTFRGLDDAKLIAIWTKPLKNLGFAEVSTSPLVNFNLIQENN
jgi:hypothetical protein